MDAAPPVPRGLQKHSPTELLAYYFTMGTIVIGRCGILQHSAHTFWVPMTQSRTQRSTFCVKKKQANQAVRVKIHAEQQLRQFQLSTFRRSPQADQSKSIPGCLPGHAGAAFINELGFQCTQKRLNGKHIGSFLIATMLVARLRQFICPSLFISVRPTDLKKKKRFTVVQVRLKLGNGAFRGMRRRAGLVCQRGIAGVGDRWPSVSFAHGP